MCCYTRSNAAIEHLNSLSSFEGPPFLPLPWPPVLHQCSSTYQDPAHSSILLPHKHIHAFSLLPSAHEKLSTSPIYYSTYKSFLVFSFNMMPTKSGHDSWYVGPPYLSHALSDFLLADKPFAGQSLFLSTLSSQVHDLISTKLATKEESSRDNFPSWGLSSTES